MALAGFLAAVLLSFERLAYVAVWRHPERFRALCARRGRDPVDALARLFYVFKALQLAVFAAWIAGFSGGVPWPPDASAPVLALAVGAGGVGQLLNASVFLRLRKVGVFYGERFGHALPWIDAFPFSVLKHPQYVGTVLSIWALFGARRFPHPDWIVLPLLETVYYALGARFERGVARRSTSLPSQTAVTGGWKAARESSCSS